MCLPTGLSQDVLEAGFSLLPIKKPAAHTGQGISPPRSLPGTSETVAT